jgi:threonine dehydratase
VNLTIADVQRAREVLRPYVPVSRLVASPSLGGAGRAVYLKLESELPTGSFKPRGAIYALTTELGRRPVREVTASSTGNHGAAVAYAAKQRGIAATIFLPKDPNPVKRARIAALGAKIVEAGGDDLAAAFQEASAYSRRDGVYFLDDASAPDLPAGPGTIAAEIFEQQPATEVVVVPMGDTALIRGLAAAAKLLSPRVKIIGVQAERAPSYVLSWREGRAIPTETCDTIADGLATRTPEADNVRAIRELVDEVRLVSDEQMLMAIRHLLLEEHLVAEPAGSAACAAILQSEGNFEGHVVALVTGANVTPEILRSALDT